MQTTRISKTCRCVHSAFSFESRQIHTNRSECQGGKKGCSKHVADVLPRMRITADVQRLLANRERCSAAPSKHHHSMICGFASNHVHSELLATTTATTSRVGGATASFATLRNAVVIEVRRSQLMHLYGDRLLYVYLLPYPCWQSKCAQKALSRSSVCLPNLGEASINLNKQTQGVESVDR